MNNKYNLQVGDVFQMYNNINDFTITYFGEKGILFNKETYYWSLTETNELLDKGDWRIKSQVNMKQYVEVVSSGFSYSSHTKAEEYGCTNYHARKGLGSAKNRDILEIVKDIIVNKDEPAYILRNEDGIEYIIGKRGVKLLENYKPMSKVEQPEPFLVKGDSKHLLKACYEEIIALGYTNARRSIDKVNGFFSTNISKITPEVVIEDYKRLYVNGSLSIDPQLVIFTLPQDYNKAIKHAREAINSPYWTQNKVKKMKFGSLEVEVEQGKGWVKIDEGVITKEDLKKVVDYIRNRPKLLGYELSGNGTEINFGCKHGTASEIIAIYEAM
jgi:hypothetical protein